MSISALRSRRLMARTAAAMSGIAGASGLLEGALPHDRNFEALPVAVALGRCVALATIGPHLPRACLAAFGPIAVIALADVVATTPGASDSAALYALPVLWTTFFYGRRGAVGIVACVAVAHALALDALPASNVYPGRWVDVMVAVTATAAVMLALGRHIEDLVAQLNDEARVDPLTGLFNRRGLQERAELEYARARHEGCPLAAVTFDIDLFKTVNDEWGHETGDHVLSELSRILLQTSPEIDCVARVGGEEFTVLLPTTDEESAREYAERVRTAALEHDWQDLPSITLSAGVASAHADGDVSRTLTRADHALYAAKRAGRNCVRCGTSDDGTADMSVATTQLSE